MRSHSDTDMLETAGKTAATTGSKKAALQKHISFKMIKLGYPMYKRWDWMTRTWCSTKTTWRAASLHATRLVDKNYRGIFLPFVFSYCGCGKREKYNLRWQCTLVHCIFSLFNFKWGNVQAWLFLTLEARSVLTAC